MVRTLRSVRAARFDPDIRFESSAPLAVSQVVGTRDTWETTAELVFRGSTRTVRVPVGSRTDWASVPPLLTWLVSPNIAGAAAVVHDHCYRVLVPAREMTYQEADGLLLEALGALDVPEASQLLTWAAVRVASMATKPEGLVGFATDLPLVAAVAGVGIALATPALSLVPSSVALALANRWARRSCEAYQGRAGLPAAPG